MKTDYANFNSTMVRLKAHVHVYMYTCKRNFNSTMVRLKGKDAVVEKHRSLIFQFHYGTIKRNNRNNTRNFNLYFNSTMVRLKVLAASVAASNLGFQFHYGTIKRFTACRCGIITAISIPLWYD